MKERNVTRAAPGTPFALCDECAPIFTAAFRLRKAAEPRTGIALLDPNGGMVVCANCQQRKPGAKYLQVTAT